MRAVTEASFPFDVGENVSKPSAGRTRPALCVSGLNPAVALLGESAWETTAVMLRPVLVGTRVVKQLRKTLR
jgi:hypothetical protein